MTTLARTLVADIECFGEHITARAHQLTLDELAYIVGTGQTMPRDHRLQRDLRSDDAVRPHRRVPGRHKRRAAA